jgi:hypothetical protein
MLVSSAAAIRLSLQPSPASDTSTLKRIRAFNSWAERLPLRINSSRRSRFGTVVLRFSHAVISTPFRNTQGTEDRYDLIENGYGTTQKVEWLFWSFFLQLNVAREQVQEQEQVKARMLQSHFRGCPKERDVQE